LKCYAGMVDTGLHVPAVSTLILDSICGEGRCPVVPLVFKTKTGESVKTPTTQINDYFYGRFSAYLSCRQLSQLATFCPPSHNNFHNTPQRASWLQFLIRIACKPASAFSFAAAFSSSDRTVANLACDILVMMPFSSRHIHANG
jgi:hypothetical protein